MTDVDFRSARRRLRPEDFALFSGEEAPPADLVTPGVWQGLTALPDDVSLRTSDRYGSTLALLWELWSQWTCVVLALREAADEEGVSPLTAAACDASEYFEASIYSALTGYYRLAHTSLRAVVENMTFGLAFELNPDDEEYGGWLEGNMLRFDGAVQRAAKQPRVGILECHLAGVTSDSLYRSRHSSRGEGLARRLHRKLSKFAHGAPGHTDADIWHSNGPIFVQVAFEEWVQYFLSVYALALLESRLGQPELNALHECQSPDVASLFDRVVGLLSSTSAAHKLFQAVPESTWR